ncbi:MAG: hypothetical protein AAGC45_10440 [Bacteroidota bacterium]
MKKLIFPTLFFLLMLTTVEAQDATATSKGSWLIEANTGFGGGDFSVANTANTSFGLSSSNGTTIWAIGAEGGHFIAEDLALKLGLGFTDLDGETIFTYKVGAKYYVNGSIPFQVDFTGASSDLFFDEDPLWLGLQGGYAIFIADNVSVEPGLRYNISLNSDFTEEGLFEFRIGFVIHL